MTRINAKASTAEAGPPLINTLYVALHGLITLVDVGDPGFIAYALEMGDDHKYLYGSWLVEQEIPERPQGAQPFIAELIGVDSGTATLNTNSNVVVKIDKAPDVDHGAVRAVFKLPRPSRIQEFTSGPLESTSLQGGGRDSVVGNPTGLSGIRIFEYEFDDATTVHLTQAIGTEPLWKCPGPVRVQKLNLNVAVLHIYDQPGEDMDNHAQHTIDEFQKSATFLGKNITLNNAVKTDARTSVTLPGLLPGETSCLSQRADEVVDLIDGLRSGIVSLGTGGCTSGGVCAACSAILRPVVGGGA